MNEQSYHTQSSQTTCDKSKAWIEERFTSHQTNTQMRTNEQKNQAHRKMENVGLKKHFVVRHVQCMLQDK